MGKTRTKGISLERDGSRTVNKVWDGERIFARLGQVSQDAAEQWLADEIASRKAARSCRRGDRALFADGAARYLIECRGKRTVETIAWHIKLLLPYIGALPLEMVHDGTLEDFREERLAGLCDGKVETKSGRALRPVTPTTVNRSLEVVRTVLMRAARAWRDADGHPLLEIAPPLITMLDENRRPPYPIDWEEQDRLMRELPGHLQNPVLFALNTGLRDENVVGLRWDWERAVPEAGRSVFIVPAASYKTGVDHVAVLNDVAWSVIEAQRGRHPVWVFPYTITRKGQRITNRLGTINNGGYQNARVRAGLPHLRVHDLRHTFASRLRLSGVAQEDRNALMGHGRASMPEHYASADIGRLIDLANRVCERNGTRTVLRVVNGANMPESRAKSRANEKGARRCNA